MTTVKRIFNSFSSFKNVFSFVVLLTLSFSLLFVSCTKEEVTIETEEPELNVPDPINDLVAYFNPLTSMLIVDPDYMEDALASLKAEPVEDGLFYMDGVNPKGEFAQVLFMVEFAPGPQIYEIAEKTDAEITSNPQLVNEFTVGSTSYRVFKNALCGVAQPGFNSECSRQDDGTSIQREWLPIRRCEAGAGYCTEANLVAGYQHVYEFNNCSGPKKSTTNLNMYQCWQ